MGMNEEMRAKIKKLLNGLMYQMYTHPMSDFEKHQGIVTDQILSAETKDYRIAVIKKGEPPLLSGEDMICVLRNAGIGMPSMITDEDRVVAEAQRSSDIEYYKWK